MRSLLVATVAVLLLVLSTAEAAQKHPDVNATDYDTMEEFAKCKRCFEGDLILNKNQKELARGSPFRLAYNKDEYLWPNAQVPYKFDKKTTENFRNIFAGAIKHIESKSCVRFIKTNDSSTYHLRVKTDEPGCFSEVGYQGLTKKPGKNFQVTNLGDGCEAQGTIVHELMHSLGFFHEHSHPKRDKYVRILFKNVNPSMKVNFRINNHPDISDFNYGYDYDSILHYGPHSFSRNGKPTVVPLAKGVQIGQRVKLSEKDTLKLNAVYSCNKKS